jgi:tRNA C32,U32 (ribose-2'-O)-methylase TrmJ
MRAMVTRADPDARELMLLRAIFIEVVRYIDRTTPRT